VRYINSVEKLQFDAHFLPICTHSLGLFYGITTCGSGIGVFVFNPLISKLMDEYLWRGAMILEAALFLHIILAGVLMLLVYKVFGNVQGFFFLPAFKIPNPPFKGTTPLILVEQERLSKSLVPDSISQ